MIFEQVIDTDASIRKVEDAIKMGNDSQHLKNERDILNEQLSSLEQKSINLFENNLNPLVGEVYEVTGITATEISCSLAKGVLAEDLIKAKINLAGDNGMNKSGEE